MERKIGEVFTYNGKTYQVIKANACRDCAFKVRLCEAIESITGTCIPGKRTDNTSVSFKLINNMENNQLTINIPKGMEIDLEKSDLTKGIVKFKKKNITYDDILQDIDSIKLRVSTYCIDKILAISQLMNIAKYYNKNWKPDWNKQSESKYYIMYDNSNNTYTVDYNNSYTLNTIYFKNKIDAQTVINNHNFKDILNIIYKD